MIQADSIIEGSKIRLYNLCSNASSTFSGWVSGTGYPFFVANLSRNIYLNRVYYIRCQVKYNTGTLDRIMMYFGGAYHHLYARSPVTANTTYDMNLVVQLSDYPYTNQGTNSLYFYGYPNNTSITKYIQKLSVYDITELRALLNNVSDLTSWCNTNLTANDNYIDIDISSYTKPGIRQGVLFTSRLIETDGMRTKSQTTAQAQNMYFDSGIPCGIYNNSSGGAVTHQRVNAATENSPFYPEHKYILKIVTNGVANPGAGGFYLTHNAAAGKRVVERFVAKVPVGYEVIMAYNSQGTGATVHYLTPRAGTGDWEEYAVLYNCGTSGSFNTGGHIYLNGGNNRSVTWYVAAMMSCTITDDTDLANVPIMANIDSIKGSKVMTRQLNLSNLAVNGDYAFVPNGTTVDFDDVPEESETRYSVVSGINARSPDIGPFNIDPQCRYKISFWSKGIRDMSSFLIAVYYYNAAGQIYTHNNTVYVKGTKQQLAQPLEKGDTSMVLKSSASNWVDLGYSHVATRSSQYGRDGDRDIKVFSNGSTGVIAGNSGNTVNFKVAYNGDTIPAGTWVVESRDGGNYPYPFDNGIFSTTNNNWTYHEAYFGYNDIRLWDGARPQGSGFVNIPCNARTMRVGLLYNNSSSQPIKFADIKIVPWNEDCGTRTNIVQLKGYTKVAPLPAKRAWLFDELVSDQFLDSKHVGNFAKVTGTTTLSKGIVTFSNSAIRTDRAGFNFNQPFSISLWVKTSNVNTTQTLFQCRTSVGDGISVFMTGSNIRFDCGGNQMESGSVISANTWYHIVCTYNRSVKTIYVNKVNKKQATITHVDQSLPNYIWAGLSSTNGTSFSANPIVGSLDDMRIYDRVLTSSEVSYVYNLRGK